MAKPINVESLLQASKSLDAEAFHRFLVHYGVEIKDYEIKDLNELVRRLRGSGCSVANLSNFFVGYKIPQISKEFDLLRFGQKNIINIELKGDASVEKIKKQLSRNKYYLSFIGKEVLAFTFVFKTKELYFLASDGNLEKAGFAELTALIDDQTADFSCNPDKLFNPSDFLVSPFNSTNKFLAEEYFLTHQQEHIKDQISAAISVSVKAQFFSIMGGAGTGRHCLHTILQSVFLKTIKSL